MSGIPQTNYVSASETKKRLSSLVRRVIAGYSFMIIDDETGEPIAELVPATDDDVESYANDPRNRAEALTV